MTDNEVIQKLVTTSGRINSNISRNLPNDIKQYLEQRFDNITSWKEALYNIIHPNEDIYCPICGKLKKFYNNTKYLKTCGSKKCIDTLSQLKSKKTKFEKYGDENYNNRDKMKHTKFLHYGNEKYINVELIKKTKLERYGNENFVTSEKALKTKLERYGSYVNTEKLKKAWNNFSDEKMNDIINKRKETKLKKYGSKNFVNSEKAKQTKLKKYNDQTFNNRTKAYQTMLNIYGVKNYANTQEWKDKISDKKWQENRKKKEYETKKKHNSFNISKNENIIYNLLLEKYNNVIRQYKSDLYPFHCDFYLPDLDLYIEYQGTWTHGLHPFNENNKEDIDKLNLWKSKNSKYYDNAINTWTIRDVNKRNIAKQNNLNWIEFFNFDNFKKWLNNNE